jgi:catechol 2,3-dioxygenase
MFDMSAGGTFSHRLAGNTWESAGLPQRPAEAAGMRQFTLQLRSEGDFTATLARVAASGHEVERHSGDALVTDPSGTRLLLAAPAVN